MMVKGPSHFGVNFGLTTECLSEFKRGEGAVCVSSHDLAG